MAMILTTAVAITEMPQVWQEFDRIDIVCVLGGGCVCGGGGE